MMCLVQFNDRCALAVVHPGSKNGTWKGMDCLEIREFKELFHIKLNEKAVADIFKNNFGFHWFFFTKVQQTSICSLIQCCSCGTEVTAQSVRAFSCNPEISIVASAWELNGTIQHEREPEQEWKAKLSDRQRALAKSL